jgi:phosphoribosylformylglycinamidine synthase
MVYRVYVEKKQAFAREARCLLQEIREFVGVRDVENVRVIQRYDIEFAAGGGDSNKALFEYAAKTVFGEPPVDTIGFEPPFRMEDGFVLAVEYLPGQFDARSDSAAQCIQLLSQAERPLVRHAKIYVFSGLLSDNDKQKIERHLINPLDSRKAAFTLPQTLAEPAPEPAFPSVLFGFTELPPEAAPFYIEHYGLAMDTADFACCAAYFRSEGRDPTLAELRVLDTYWSDHCRHTTFETALDTIEIHDERVQKTYARYLELRKKLGREGTPVTLMDIATIGARALLAEGRGGLENWERSEEVNACSVKIDVAVGGKTEPYLLMFKNETHNHPTEIEPFGGAATCIGGAIRDPLSGRAYVYQSMRVSGCANPLAAASETLPGKLPQRKITQEAAAGYSSYGNQIGIATGHVTEIYHEGYAAKRLETGAVLGAVPLANVRRERPAAGDLVILLGGRTGRDGCGGASGSSKAHKKESIETCGAEVQRGNAPTERKLQRLFSNPDAARLIKKCNDFGAGGVAVAVGELADGLEIDLDAVPKKYEGLDGIELAISESQERMAVVLAPADVPAFLALAAGENLEAAVIAKVTANGNPTAAGEAGGSTGGAGGGTGEAAVAPPDDARLIMKWRGRAIVNISRAFLNTNGAKRTAGVVVE